MSPLPIIATLVVTAGVSYLATPFTIWLARRVGALDFPGPRKIHQQPIGRLGGLAVLFAGIACVDFVAVLGWPLSLNGLSRLGWGLGLGLPPIVVVSFLDDLRGVRTSLKLAVHVLAAAMAVYAGVALQPVVHFLGQEINLGVWAAPLSLFWLIGVTNAFNIIDGLDGLASGLALISSGSLASVFLISGQGDMAFVSAAFAAALLGFLPYNLYPARVFLGDTGATATGFAIGCLTLSGSTTMTAGFAAMLPVVLIGIPVTDTMLAVVRRAVKRITNGKSTGVLHPDSEHIHHRLLALGVTHRAAVLTLYSIAILLAALGLLSIFMSAVESGLMLTAVIVATLVGISRLGYEEFAFIRHGTVLKIYNARILKRGLFAVFVDLVFVGLSVYGAIGLKIDHWEIGQVRVQFVPMVVVLMPATLLSFWAFSLYKGEWRFAGVHEFVKATVAVVVSSLLGLLVLDLLSDRDVVVSTFAIYALLQVCVINGSRASYRILKDRQECGQEDGVRTLIYGAGRRGAAILRELRSNSQLGLTPVGFVDDDETLAKKAINGVQVLCHSRELSDTISRTGARVLIVSSESISLDRVAAAYSTCEALGVRMARAHTRLETLGTDGLDRPDVVCPDVDAVLL